MGLTLIHQIQINITMQETSTAMERVEYGLDTIPPDQMVTVPLRDLMFVHQTLAVYVQFFHQRLHYPTLEAVHEFMEKSGCGGFEILREAYYHRMGKMLPQEIHDAFDEGYRFDHPLPPRYFNPDFPNDKKGKLQ